MCLKIVAYYRHSCNNFLSLNSALWSKNQRISVNALGTHASYTTPNACASICSPMFHNLKEVRSADSLAPSQLRQLHIWEKLCIRLVFHNALDISVHPVCQICAVGRGNNAQVGIAAQGVGRKAPRSQGAFAVARWHGKHQSRAFPVHDRLQEPVQLGADPLVNPPHEVSGLDVLDKGPEALPADLEPEGLSKKLPVHLRFRFPAP